MVKFSEKIGEVIKMTKLMDNTTQQDVDVCAVLNTYMYLDYKMAKDGANLYTIIKDIERRKKN